MKVSLVISTYNSPASLRRCLLGFLSQSRPPDQVVVSDDGSRSDTRDVIASSDFSALPIEHVWQPDHGWRKPKALNLSLSHCVGDYVVFCDGDCIPRSDFIAAHLRASRPRTFVSGSMLDVPDGVHRGFGDAEILDNSIFRPEVLEARWPGARRYRTRLVPGRWEGLLNLASYRFCVLRGSNVSAWLDDLREVNGFDENFGYGSDDRELGVRLRNAGVASRWLKFSLVQLHMSHSRGGIDNARMQRQRWRFRALFLNGKTRTEPGIDTAIVRGLADPHGPYRHGVVHAPDQDLPATLPFPNRRGQPMPKTAVHRAA